MDVKVIEKLLVCDFSKEENQKLMKETLCKLKPLSKFSLSSEQIPFDAFEKMIFANSKKYNITIQYIIFQMLQNGEMQWQISIKRDDKQEWLGSYIGKTIYEAFCKCLLKMCMCIKFDNIPIRESSFFLQESKKLKEDLGKIFSEEGEETKTNKTNKKIRVFTDGACSGNIRAGGYGVILLEEKEVTIIGGCSLKTTNNIMELIAVWDGVRIAKNLGYTNIEIHSDSAYVINSVTQGWLNKWKRNGWKTVKGEDVKNKNEWVLLDNVLYDNKINVTFVKVKGHSGNQFNEMADKEAVRQSAIAKKVLSGSQEITELVQLLEQAW